MAARFQLLVFDFDGTLIDSSIDLANAVNHVMRHFGFPEHNTSEIRSYVGDGARALVDRALPPDKKHLLEEGLKVYLQHYEANLLSHTGPYPGISEMLDALAGIPKAIATNKSEKFTKKIVSGLGWDRLFNQIIGGDSLAGRKPDAIVLRTICDRMGISPVGTLMVGDGPQDVGAARAAGAASCGVTWGFRGEELIRDAKPDYLVAHPLEIVQLL